MKLKNIFLAALMFATTLVQAQLVGRTTAVVISEHNEVAKKPNRFVLGVEFGSDFMTGSFLSDKWDVRQNVSHFGWSHGGSLFADANSFYFGIKPEFIFCNERWSVASGLRYRSMNNMLRHSGFQTNFFYLRYDDNSMNTKYARVRGISENYQFLGIPLELKWIPFRFPNPNFNVHLIAGTDVYFRLDSNVEIDFVNDFMKAEQATILDFVGVETNSIFARAYFGFGASHTFENGMKLSADLLFPTILTKNNSALMQLENHVALQFSFQFPLSK